MTWMLKNSQGRPDSLMTFSAGAVAVVLVKLLFHGVTLPNGISFGTIDAGLIAAVLTPTIGAYTAKRVMGGKADAKVDP